MLQAHSREQVHNQMPQEQREQVHSQMRQVQQEQLHNQMLQVQEAGADAIIVQDLAIVEMARNGIGNMKEDLHIPLHASTQCAIRTPEQAA